MGRSGVRSSIAPILTDGTGVHGILVDDPVTGLVPAPLHLRTVIRALSDKRERLRQIIGFARTLKPS